MVKFYEISTDQFKPLSHDNQYLFNRYEQVANFLAKYLDKSYKDILARPIQKGYVVEWYSQFEDLKDVRNETALAISGYHLYYQFLEALELKIEELSKSKDVDNQDWAKILTHIFNEKDNFIFCNGEEIAIVWGWGFNNNKIYKPDLETVAHPPNIIPEDEEIPVPPIESNPPNEDVVEDNPFIEEEPEEEIIEEEIEEETEPEDIQPKENKFLEFLKWFASKYWWLLIVLITLIAFVFTLKAIKYS